MTEDHEGEAGDGELPYRMFGADPPGLSIALIIERNP